MTDHALLRKRHWLFAGMQLTAEMKNPIAPAMPVAVLIPAYRPERRLIDLVRALSARNDFENIIVVDDGGGPDFQDIFS